LDAKKRLKAIVEANELGAGFQIAMKDLEIRGAGDILGANQSGAIQVVGVSHFIRMLNQAVEDMKKGRSVKEDSALPDVTIEVPLPAYIPDEYIVSSKDKRCQTCTRSIKRCRHARWSSTNNNQLFFCFLRHSVWDELILRVYSTVKKLITPTK
jgi:transcription-repair coupling factor (superfamily II helicase)